MNKAIFLDRDGVILDNHQHYYIWKPDQIKFVEGIFKNLIMLQKKDYQIFIVSNQGGISRGFHTKEETSELHFDLIDIFRQNQILITDILFCPHHPELEKCLCRKPGHLMIEKLIAKYGLNPHDSFFIGDNETDMNAAAGAGIRGIKIEANQNMYPYISGLINE